MALKLADETAAPPVVPRDTKFSLRRSKRDGAIYLRAETHDGKKFRIADITDAGLKLRPSNNHAALGIAVDASGRAKTITG